MKKALITRAIVMSVAVTVLGFNAVSCVDSDYDVSQDIDMTIGVGTEGLKFKLGSTQKILMKNVLEVDEDFKTDASNMYYLIKNGNTKSDFNIARVSSSIEDVHYTTDAPVVDYSKISSIIAGAGTTVPVKAGFVYDVPEEVEAKGNFKYTISDIDEAILSLERINFDEGAKIKISLMLENKGMDFNFYKVNNMKITIPESLEITDFSGGSVSGSVLNVNDNNNMSGTVFNIGEAKVKGAILKDVPITADRLMQIATEVKFNSNFSFKAASDFNVNNGDEVNVSVVLSVEDYNGTNGTLTVKSALGKFDPEINPDIDDIDISSSLPDFLKDDDVTISVSNPTFKFVSDMKEIPASLKFNISTTSTKNGQETANVWIPGKDKQALLHGNSSNTLYFHQSENGPYDPEGVVAGADSYLVPNISDLVHKLPDFIKVDLSDGKVKIDNEKNTLIELGRDYRFAADYNVYVPFQFDAGLKIVYTDSIDSMNEDLQDYEADSAAVSAIVENHVPLDLNLEIIPLGINGEELTCIHVDKVKVNAAGKESVTNTEIYLNVKLDNRSDLKKLDRLMLRISASSIDNGLLNSEQYIQVKDIRLILKGQVVCDLN